MGQVSKPIALDESLNTTESPSRNIADVLAEELGNLIVAVSRIAPQTTYDELDKLEDVNISAPTNGQVLKYNSVTQKWENGTGGGSGDTVTWNQIQGSGTKIAEIGINGTTTDVYAPSSSATITLVVTCDAVFQGETLTLTKGVTTLTQTVPAGLEVTFNVPSLGTWVLSNTYNADTESIDMNYYGQYAITLTGHTIPVGSSATPTDDIQTLLNCATIWDKSYTTLSELLADTTTLQAVISSNNAIDYLVRSTTWASDMCADSTAMSYISLNNYASNTLLADSMWASAILTSPYFESVDNLKVPAMTSNNTPSGVASATLGDLTAYKAFDGDNSTVWDATTSGSSNQRVVYDFGRAVKINKFFLLPNQAGNTTYCRVKNYKIESSDDCITWNTEYTGLFVPPNTDGQSATFTMKEKRYWSCLVIDHYTTSDRGIQIFTLQFYGREDV